MNADKLLVFNPPSSAFIGDHQFGRLFQLCHHIPTLTGRERRFMMKG
jgi:hypothetical protein